MREPRGSRNDEGRRNGRLNGNAPQAQLAALVDRHLAGVFRFLRAMTGDGEVARDLTQDTFLRIQQAPPASPAEASEAVYVFTVARNTAVSYLRRRVVEHRHISQVPPEEVEVLAGPSRSGAGDPAGELERSELRGALWRALSEIPEMSRAVFLLSELEGLTYDEIGRVVGCPPGTVASRKHHAVRKLRQALGREGFAA